MNVVFISPHFPPSYENFCVRLRDAGATVLGIGDVPREQLTPSLAGALTDYVQVDRLDHYDTMLRAVAYLTWRHGRIDHLDSHNEHFLGIEAQLREDFNIDGLRPEATARYRSKLGMAEVMAQAGLRGPVGEAVVSPEQVRAFARRVGYPVIIKPDIGVGAELTFKIANEQELSRVLTQPLAGYLVQKFVTGTVTSFDGLVDRDGRILFCTSFVYSAGVLEYLQEWRDVFFYSRREIPPRLEELGRRLVAAFDLRERFFHAELFELPDGDFCPLEMNLRPPGGMTLDLMNFACDVDLYRLWADLITGADVGDFTYERKYHAAHVARRERRYRYSHAELCERLGPMLMGHGRLPDGLRLMGTDLYLIRSPERDELLRAAEMILAVG